MFSAVNSPNPQMLHNKTVENIQPPIDMEHLGRFTMKDRDLEREILDLFVDTLAQTLKILKEAKVQIEWKMAAHTLKGSAKAVGAWQLADLMEKAEKCHFGSEATPQRQNILSDLEVQAAEIMSYISNMTANA